MVAWAAVDAAVPRDPKLGEQPERVFSDFGQQVELRSRCWKAVVDGRADLDSALADEPTGGPRFGRQVVGGPLPSC
jgi:hypothetical protein